MITNNQIRKIKTLQRICCLDDDSYRAILRNQAGVNSSKELRSKRQIDSVITYLNNLTEKIDKKAKRTAEDWKWENSTEGLSLMTKAKKISLRPNRPSLQQFQFIWGLWWTLRDEWKSDNVLQMEPSLNHFLENGRGGEEVKVASWQWLTYDKAHHLINVLKGRVNKNKKKPSGKSNKQTQ